ncbi:oligodendrocyte-myelin glycoprotein-like [Branchiostoma floridae x Branchiostoma belcheri]
MPEAHCFCQPSPLCKRNLGLTSIPQNLPTSIPSLYLVGNRIKTVKQSELLKYKNMCNLCLQKNLITKIEAGTFANYLPRLEYLAINANKIAEIQPGSFVNLSQLREVWLSNNQITTILQKLNLYTNAITTIHSDTFADLPLLQSLELENSQITTIHSGALANLPQIQTLELGYNQITTIHSEQQHVDHSPVSLLPVPIYCQNKT